MKRRPVNTGNDECGGSLYQKHLAGKAAVQRPANPGGKIIDFNLLYSVRHKKQW